MSQNIHPSAVIEVGVQIADDVSIGPFCHVGPDAVLGAGVKLHSHVVVSGHTTIGAGTTVYPFASLGHAPQDLKYSGEPSRLVIGENNTIREHVTMNPGTADDRMETTVGDNCLFMVGVHIAHDCVVGNRVIMANNATLAGHVHVGDHAILGGLCAVRQKTRIGKGAIIGGLAGVESDVIPYGLVKGERAWLAGLNLVGLKRSGVTKEQTRKIMQVYRDLFEAEGNETLSQRIAQVSAGDNPQVDEILSFLTKDRLDESRLLCLPRRAA